MNRLRFTFFTTLLLISSHAFCAHAGAGTAGLSHTPAPRPLPVILSELARAGDDSAEPFMEITCSSIDPKVLVERLATYLVAEVEKEDIAIPATVQQWLTLQEEVVATDANLMAYQEFLLHSAFHNTCSLKLVRFLASTTLSLENIKAQKSGTASAPLIVRWKKWIKLGLHKALLTVHQYAIGKPRTDALLKSITVEFRKQTEGKPYCAPAAGESNQHLKYQAVLAAIMVRKGEIAAVPKPHATTT